MHGYDGWGAAGWIGMALMMLVFWGLLVAGVVVLVRSFRPDARHDAEVSARQLLDERFARGELSEEEYTQRRSVLARR